MDVFDLSARITLDSSDYEKNLEDSKKKTSGLGDYLKGAMKTAAQVGTAAMVAASGAVIGLVKSATDSYKDYEQLVGGVETLYKDSAKQIFQYADDAYKTAGLSANEYMELSTSFAASLINSLNGDTGRAVELANTAITDMSDNVNKMGSSVESVQNAYNGFAKGNFTINLMSVA